MATTITMPQAAEGLESATILDVKVKPGDTVAAGQVLLEIEAEKSTVELPAPSAGRIAQVLVKKGDEVPVGKTLFLLEDGVAVGPAAVAPAASPVVVPTPPPAPPPLPPAPRITAGNGQTSSVESSKAPGSAVSLPLAGPATRRLARELGVDLTLVRGSGRRGRVTEEDVKTHVRQLTSSIPTKGPTPAPTAPRLPDFSRFGPIEQEPLSQVRRLTAQQMSLSWSLVPHVTQHDLADVTDLEAFRKAHSGEVKLTVTAFALKACAIALRQFPTVNSSLDLASHQLILKRYYHLGVAVDTERGLLVPVVRDVDRKSIAELAKELTEVAERARQGKADMQGGTFTITNLGGIGGTGFTPIVNYPEVAILGLSRSRWQGEVREGQMVPRLMLPLSLSYDHRVIDGALAARFTRRVAELLENPMMMLLHA